MSSRVEITLKAGQTIVADATEFRIQKGPFGITGMNWTTPAGAERALMHVSIDEVSSVVFVEENTDEQPQEGQGSDEDPPVSGDQEHEADAG